MSVHRQTNFLVAAAVAILFFIQIEAFVLRDQPEPSYYANQKRGASRLAEALNALEDQSKSFIGDQSQSRKYGPRGAGNGYRPSNQLAREQAMLDYFESEYLKNADKYGGRDGSQNVIGNGYYGQPDYNDEDYYGDYVDYANGYDIPSQEPVDYTYEDYEGRK